MNWFCPAISNEPLTENQLIDHIRAGRIQSHELVRPENRSVFKPLSAFPDLAAKGAGERGICVECNKSFSTNELLFFSNSFVCASCKPIFLQRLKEGAASVGVWRKNKEIIATHGAVFPPRCVKCNVPVEGGQLIRNLTWHSSLLYLLILLNLLIYLIVAILVRKKTHVLITLCPQHRKARRQAILWSWIILLVSGGAAVFTAAREQWGLFFLAVGFFLVAAIWGVLKARLIYTLKMDAEYVWVKGAGRTFLESLPYWENQP